MIFRRLFDPKLAQASYLIGCSVSREAIVVDPSRAVDRYLRAAREEGLKVAHVTETHIHADFVSGARELAHRTGARLYLSGAGGSVWGYRYADESKAIMLDDGACIRVGTIQLQVLHVPGHTPEHLAFLVTDTSKALEPMGALTGDFLFVGDVGRPDLLERAARATGTMEEAARQLFRSLQSFRNHPEYLQIWPGHGAGSACGKSLSAVPQSTLGYERRFNWAFNVTTESEFVRGVLAGQPEPPRYFAEMKRINQSGPRLLDEVRADWLPPDALAAALGGGNTVIDTRDATNYGQGSIPGTINIPANRAFTTWAGSLVPYDRDLQLIVDDTKPGLAEELTRDLAGIGLDRVTGYFGLDAVQAWRRSHGELQRIPALTLPQVSTMLGSQGSVLLDVREKSEWRAGHIPGSQNVPVGQLNERLGDIPRNGAVVVHCQTGARAAIAASVLQASGFNDVRLFTGGFAEWRAAGKPVEGE